jgi:hypothetical protein
MQSRLTDFWLTTWHYILKDRTLIYQVVSYVLDTKLLQFLDYILQMYTMRGCEKYFYLPELTEAFYQRNFFYNVFIALFNITSVLHMIRYLPL